MTINGLESLKHFLSGKKRKPDSRPPFLLSWRSSTTFILLTVCLAVFTDILLYALIVPVLPYALTTQVGVPEHEIQQWNAILLACYSCALFIGSPIFGMIADHTSSRRLPLLIGLLALAASTLLLCLGKSIGLLVLGRLLQGLSAAIVWSVGLALLADTMGANIGVGMGYTSIAMSGGLLVSPVIGGAVYANCGYYAVFYIAFGVIILDIILRFILIEKKVARQWLPDQSGQPSGSAVLGEPPAAGESGSAAEQLAEKRADDSGTASQDDSATAVSPAFVSSAPSSKAKHPNLRLLKSRRILAALFGILIQAGIMVSFDTVIPLFVKTTFNWSATAAGLIFFCVFVPSAVLSPPVGWMSDRYGAKWPSLAGFVASVPLLVCLRFVTDNSIRHKVLLGALLALMGVALTFANVPLMAEITYAIEAEDRKTPGVWGEKGVYGIGYGLFCMAFALGSTIGSIMSGYIVARQGWITATWALGVWCAGGAVVVLIWVGGDPPPRSKEKSEQNDVERGGDTVNNTT